MKNYVTIFGVLLTGMQALANPFNSLKDSKDALCYGREYSSQHMSQNEKQQIQKMRAKLYLSDSEFKTPILSVEASLTGEKNEYKNYKASFVCLDSISKDTVKCFIECDGGSIEITGKDEGDRLVFKNNGFVLQGGCGEEEADFAWLNEAKGGDDIFYLYKLRKEYCQN